MAAGGHRALNCALKASEREVRLPRADQRPRQRNGLTIALARKLGFRSQRDPGDATVTVLRWAADEVPGAVAPAGDTAAIGAVAHADLWHGAVHEGAWPRPLNPASLAHVQ